MKQQSKPKLNPSHYWKIDKFYWSKRMDTDNDGVKDQHDCKPLDPRHQDLPGPGSVQQQVQQYMQTRLETAQRNLPRAEQRVKELEELSKKLEQKGTTSLPQPASQRDRLIQQLQEQAKRNPAMRQQYTSVVQRMQSSQPVRTAQSTQITRTGAPTLTTLQRPKPVQQPIQQSVQTPLKSTATPVYSKGGYSYYNPPNPVSHSLLGRLLGWK
jgi:hypothetical protein